MKKLLLLTLITSLTCSIGFSQNSVMDYFNAKAKEMAAARPGGPFKMKLKVKNVRNGYLKYDYNPALGYMIGVVESPEEMAYFIANNGRKFVAISTAQKLVIEKDKFSWSWDMPQFFELQNGRLINKNEKYLPKNLRAQIEQATGSGMWFKLPQVGTSIIVGRWNGKAPLIVGELKYNVADGTFRFVRK